MLALGQVVEAMLNKDLLHLLEPQAAVVPECFMHQVGASWWPKQLAESCAGMLDHPAQGGTGALCALYLGCLA